MVVNLEDNFIFWSGANELLKQKMMLLSPPCPFGPHVLWGHLTSESLPPTPVSLSSMSRVLPRTWFCGQGGEKSLALQRP